jgi:Leucine-rich repeat (LRR) protein
MRQQAFRNSRRKWLRLSVRGLLVLVLVIGIWTGWIVRQARIQREAVAAIDNVGGIACARYDSDLKPGSSRNQLSSWKKWIEEYIGIDFVDYVAVVQLKSSGNEADWQQAVNRLTDLGQVRVLNLMGRYVNDDVLAQLEGMNCLELLMLQHTGNSDAGLAHVQNLTNLKTVYISGSRISDAGLAHLKGLTKLSDLSLQWMQVSDAGLMHLRGLTNLSELSLSGTNVSDAGLAHLSRLTNLSRLALGHTHISDAGLAHLKGLTKLSRLDFRHTQVSDAGLVHLRVMTNLRRVDLDYNTQVTDAGIRALKQALPRLTIEQSF